MDSVDWTNAWLVTTVALFSTGHYIGGTFGLLFALAHSFSARIRAWLESRLPRGRS